MNTSRLGVLALLLVGFLLGLSGPLTRYLSTSFGAFEVVALRFLAALLFALIFMIYRRHKFNMRGVKLGYLIAYAVFFPLSVTFFVLAVFQSKVSLTIFSFYCANFISSFILGKVLFREKVDITKATVFAIMMLALVCFAGSTKNLFNLGLIFGLLSGILQTIASMYQKLVKDCADRTSLVVTQLFSGVLIALVFTAATNSLRLSALSAGQWAVLFISGLIFFLLPYLNFFGYKKVNLNVGAILTSTELLFGPVFALILLRESPNQMQVLGGALVCLGVYIVSAPPNHRLTRRLRPIFKHTAA